MKANSVDGTIKTETDSHLDCNAYFTHPLMEEMNMKKYSFCVYVNIEDVAQLMAYVHFHDREFAVMDLEKVHRLDVNRPVINVEIITLNEENINNLLDNTRAIRVW